MEHTVNFGDKNTWEDWHLISSTKPIITMPSKKSKWVEIPGTDGQIDVYKRLWGLPLYENRSGSLEFTIADYMDRPWTELYEDIAAHLHGRAMPMVLQDDPLYYYEGVFTLEEMKAGSNFSTVRIGYTVGPYKYEVTDDFANWDPMDWEMNHAGEVTSAKVEGSKTVAFTTKRAGGVVFFCSAPMQVTIGDKTYKLPSGLTRDPHIRLTKGAQSLAFTGTGKVQIDFRGGIL